MNEYSNKALEAIQTMIDASIAKISFDQTIVAKIVAQDEKDLTKYLVEIDTLKFYAYSGDVIRNYSPGTKIKVLIPNGDYSEDKIILGAISSNEEVPNVSSNKFINLITDKTLNMGENFKFLYNPPYDYIGLTLYLYCTKEQTDNFYIKILLDNISDTTNYLLFSRQEILGNPEDINPLFPQNKLFEYPKNLKASDIQINIQILNENLEEDNSLVTIKNWKIQFGYDKEKNIIAEGSIKLFAAAGSEKTYSDSSSQESGYLEYYDGKDLYSINAEQQLENNFAIVKYTRGWTATPDTLEEKLGNHWKTIQASEMQFVTDFNIGSKDTRYKAIIKQKENYYISDVLVYNNTNITDNVGASNEGEPIVISLDNNDTGIYNYYGLDGHIKGNYHQKERKAIAEFINDYIIQPEDKIEWFYPNKETGLFNISTNENVLTYYLNSKCYPSYNNNTITCRITRADTGEVSEGSFTFEFGGAGNAGTEYALNIDFDQEEKFARLGKPLKLKATFERIDGESLDVIVKKYKWSWYSGPEEEIADTEDSLELQFTDSENLAKYAIIRVEVEYILHDNDTNSVYIRDYLPIPTLIDPNIVKPYTTGPNRIVYDMSNNLSFDNSDYKFYSNEVEDVTVFWKLLPEDIHYHRIKISQIKDQPIKYYLEPADGALIGAKPKTAVAICKRDEQTLWYSPILTIHNSWQIQKLNNWNGDQQITDEGIFSPFIVAGTKNNDNTFTGSALGSINSKFGLYGYKNGQPRYWLNEDGDFFVGDGENNKIQFDDNGLDIRAKKFLFKSEQGGKKYFELDSENSVLNLGNKLTYSPDNGLVVNDIIANSGKIGEWGLYNGGWLYSGFYDYNKEKGFGIGLNPKAPGQENKEEYVAFGIGTMILDKDGFAIDGWSNCEFRVMGDGTLYATGAIISGNVSANEGDIGGWKIKSGGIYKTFSHNGINYETMLNTQLYLNDPAETTVFQVNVNGEPIFYVRPTGYMYATNAHIEGYIKATSGEFTGIIKAKSGDIGGWQIHSYPYNLLGSINTSNNMGIGLYPAAAGSDSIAFGIGKMPNGINGTWENCAFRVSGTGKVYATDVTITGTIQSKSVILDNVKMGNSQKTVFGDYGDGSTVFGTLWQADYIGSGHSYMGVTNTMLTLVGTSKYDETTCTIDLYGNVGNEDQTARSGIFFSADMMQLHTNYPEAAHSNTKGSSYIFARESVTLHADNGYVYAGAGATSGNSRVAVDNQGPSSRILKKNIKDFTSENYYEALSLLKNIKLYSYDYKYRGLGRSQGQQYGFIIDDLLENPIANKYFCFIDEQALITETNELDYLGAVEWPDNPNIIEFKRYDEETLIKYLLTCLKALQYEVIQLQNEIKEIKNNEIN